MKLSKECDGAHVLIMKYMDGELSEAEALALRRHVDSCKSCKADFEIYDFISGELENTGLTPAPEGFTAEVMAIVRTLPSPRKAFSLDGTLRLALGLFSILFGIGFLLVMNRDRVMEYLSGVPVIGALTDAAAPVVNAFGTLLAGLSETVAGAAMTALNFISEHRFIAAGIVLALVALQFILFRKKAGRAKSK